MILHVRAVTHADHDAAIRAYGFPVPVEQSARWAAYEAELPGRQPWRTLLVENSGSPVAAIALVRYTGRAMVQLWAKHGPTWLVDEPTPKLERALRSAVADYVRRHDPAAAVLRLHAVDSQGCELPLVSTQWDRTVVLDIDRSDDDIMATMSKSGRRDLRYGLKNDDVTVVDESNIAAEDFANEIFPVFQETANRAGFSLLEARTYYGILDALRPEHARLFVARVAGEPVCWGLFTHMDGRGVYYFAASGAKARNTFAVYKLVWEAIRALRSLGAQTLDFYGVSSQRCPDLTSLDDFKLKWTRGVATDAPGSWDIVLRPGVMTLYRARGWAARAVTQAVERVRGWVHKAR